MMEVLHITETKNLPSIKKYDLLPKKPYLNHHFDYFKRPIIYTFPNNDYNKEKYIRDFVYFQIWGKPRNLYLEKLGDNYPEKWEYLPDHIKIPKIENVQFSVLKLSIHNDDILTTDVYHVQDKTMCMFQDMKEEYTHNDKPLIILKNKISSYNIQEKYISYPIIRNNDIKEIKIDKCYI